MYKIQYCVRFINKLTYFLYLYDIEITNIITNLKLNYKIRLNENQFPNHITVNIDTVEMLSKNALFEIKLM